MQPFYPLRAGPLGFAWDGEVHMHTADRWLVRMLAATLVSAAALIFLIFL